MAIKFLKKILVMTVLMSCTIVAYLVLYKSQISKIKLEKNKKIIVCGDSHTQAALNDSELDYLINISQSSEPYLATYNVIKTLIQNNSEINSIVLGYSFHNLSKLYDNVVYKEKYKPNFYATYLPILDRESISIISKHNLSGLLKSIPKSLNTWITIKNTLNMNPISYKNYVFFGNYYMSKLSNFNKKTINNSIQRHYYDGKTISDFSIIQEKFLYKIVRLCIKKNIKLFLINTPLRIEYFNQIPKKFIHKYYNTIKKLGTKVELIDFHSLKLADKCFGDGDHLNVYGAKILTIKLDRIFLKRKIK